MNPFKVNDRVATLPTATTQRNQGRVKYVACYDATAKGGATCNKKTCLCADKDFVWVEWATGQTFSYQYVELMLDPTANAGVSNAAQAAPASPDSDLPAPVKSKDAIADEFQKSVRDLVGARKTTTEKPFDFDLYNGIKRLPNGGYRSRQ